jgi:hypothetical protein
MPDVSSIMSTLRAAGIGLNPTQAAALAQLAPAAQPAYIMPADSSGSCGGACGVNGMAGGIGNVSVNLGYTDWGPAGSISLTSTGPNSSVSGTLDIVGYELPGDSVIVATVVPAQAFALTDLEVDGSTVDLGQNGVALGYLDVKNLRGGQITIGEDGKNRLDFTVKFGPGSTTADVVVLQVLGKGVDFLEAMRCARRAKRGRRAS